MNSKSRSPRGAGLVATAIGAVAIGAVAVGAFAIGALAVGRLAIRRMTIESARFRSLEIEDVTVARLHAREVVITNSLALPGNDIHQQLSK